MSPEEREKYWLSRQARKNNVLVIKKQKDLTIEKNIGQIFRSHNILKFKPPTDNLNVGDYSEMLAYALNYSSFEKVHIDDITLLRLQRTSKLYVLPTNRTF